MTEITKLSLISARSSIDQVKNKNSFIHLQYGERDLPIISVKIHANDTADIQKLAFDISGHERASKKLGYLNIEYFPTWETIVKDLTSPIPFDRIADLLLADDRHNLEPILRLLVASMMPKPVTFARGTEDEFRLLGNSLVIIYGHSMIAASIDMEEPDEKTSYLLGFIKTRGHGMIRDGVSSEHQEINTILRWIFRYFGPRGSDVQVDYTRRLTYTALKYQFCPHHDGLPSAHERVAAYKYVTKFFTKHAQEMGISPEELASTIALFETRLYARN